CNGYRASAELHAGGGAAAEHGVTLIASAAAAAAAKAGLPRFAGVGGCPVSAWKAPANPTCTRLTCPNASVLVCAIDTFLSLLVEDRPKVAVSFCVARQSICPKTVVA